MSELADGPGPWDLRQAGPQSGDVLARLWRQTFEEAYSSVHSRADIEAYCAANYSVERATSALSDPRHICKLAYRQDVATGLYVLKRHACPVPLEGEAAELKQLYVLASEYGSGLGHALLNDCIETTRSIGAVQLWLAVADTNKRAQSFYFKHGFAPLGPGPVFNVGADRLTSAILALAI